MTDIDRAFFKAMALVWFCGLIMATVDFLMHWGLV